MKRQVGMLIALVAATTGFGSIQDSSDLIFNNSVVNDYHIAFYIDSWRDSLLANYKNDQVYMPARFTWRGPGGDSVALDSVGVRYKGNSSFSMASTSEKKPFKVYFNKYRKEQTFFGVEKLNFSNDVMDPSCMREKVAWDIMSKYMLSPRTAFASLTVGDSLVECIYTQVEEIDEVFIRRHFSNKIYNLYKTTDEGASFKYQGGNQSNYAKEYELKTNTDEDNWGGLIDMLDAFNNTSDASFVKEAGKFLELDDCIRSLAFNMVNSNFDSYTGSSRNFYLYDDRKGGKFRMIPWDFNLAFGNFANGWNVITVDAFAPQNLDIRPMAKRILANDSLRQVYARYITDMITGPASADSVAALAHRYQPLIDSIVKGDVKKFFPYEQFIKDLDSDVVIKVGPNTTIYPGLRSFAEKRNQVLATQVANPVLDPIAGRRVRGALLECISGPMGRNVVIRYAVRTGEARVVLNVHNARGELLRSIPEGMKGEGTHTTKLDTRALPPGYYAVSLKAGKTSASTGIMLMKVE